MPITASPPSLAALAGHVGLACLCLMPAHAAVAQTAASAPVSSAPAATTGPQSDKPAAPRLSATDIRQMAATCANCHGPDADHPVDDMPVLHGQPVEHLARRMRAFRDERSSLATVMPRLMQGIDDAEIDALADWFASGGRKAKTGEQTR